MGVRSAFGVDPLTWAFVARHDVRFNDGSPFSVKRIPSFPNNPGLYTSKPP